MGQFIIPVYLLVPSFPSLYLSFCLSLPLYALCLLEIPHTHLLLCPCFSSLLSTFSFPFLSSPLSLQLLQFSPYLPSFHPLMYRTTYVIALMPTRSFLCLLSCPIRDLGIHSIYYFTGIMNL